MNKGVGASHIAQNWMRDYLKNWFKPKRCPEGEQYFFLHTPKTGGTLFRRQLEQYFDPDRILPNPSLQERFEVKGYLTTEQFKSIPRAELDRFQLVCGHYQYREVFAHFSKPPKLLFMMREPLERCVSEIKHILRQPDHDMRRKLPSKPSVEDVINNPEIRFYLQHLLQMVLVPELDGAKRIIDQAEFVGLQEHMPESLALLDKTLGWGNVGIAEIPTLNAAPESQQNVDDQLTEAVKADIRSLLVWDYELYEYCLTNSKLDL